MVLIDATPEHLRKLMSWFPNERSLAHWGGPRVRYPFTEGTLLEDLRFGEFSSHALVDESRAFIGFGQYSLRAGRCHLSRLAIAPSHRGRGSGSRMIALLAELGSVALETTECSLFVYTDNERARRFYERLGFISKAIPEREPDVPNCDYMVASVEILKQR